MPTKLSPPEFQKSESSSPPTTAKIAKPKSVDPGAHEMAVGTIVHQHTKDDGKTLILESIKQEEVAGVLVPTPHAVVSYSGGRTFSDGNFGSFKVAVFLSVPCEKILTEIDASYDFARQWVNDRLRKELKGTPVGEPDDPA